MLVYVFALVAAFLFAVGSVVQQHAAAQAPPQDVMSFRLLWWLVRRRLWWIGIITALVGNAFSATALGRGGVTIVEPLLSTRLLFVLPMMGFWVRRGPARRDVVAAVVTAIGLSMFIVAGQPSVPKAGASGSDLHWALGGGIVVAVAVVAALGGRGLPALKRAPLLAGAAGLLFGLQATLTSDADRLVGHPLTLLTSWLPYGVLAVAVLATLFLQSAYEMAPLPSSFPAGATTEPITGVILGVTVLGGSIQLGAPELALEVLGLALMVAGIFVLARSPLVVGELLRVKIRDDEGVAYQREHDLLRALHGLEETLDLVSSSPHPNRPRPRDQRRLRGELERVERELVRLGAVLRDLEQVHAMPVPAVGGDAVVPVPVDRDTLRLEQVLRRRARELAGRTAALCVRAEALLATAR
ncbi:MAG TPA: DMT family transporter [Mycobacteriales bacterium]